MTEIDVFTDGACSNNGKENARAGIGIFFGEGDERNFSGRIRGKQSNNTAELKAIIKVADILKTEIKQGIQVNVYTDSSYSIKCLTTYGDKQEKQKWMKKIPNLKLVKKAYRLYWKKKNVKFFYVKAHTKATDRYSIGNRHADRLATSSIKK